MKQEQQKHYERPTLEELVVCVEQGFAGSLDGSGGFIGTADDITIIPATGNSYDDKWEY